MLKSILEGITVTERIHDVPINRRTLEASTRNAIDLEGSAVRQNCSLDRRELKVLTSSHPLANWNWVSSSSLSLSGGPRNCLRGNRSCLRFAPRRDETFGSLPPRLPPRYREIASDCLGIQKSIDDRLGKCRYMSCANLPLILF